MALCHLNSRAMQGVGATARAMRVLHEMHTRCIIIAKHKENHQ